MESGSFDDSLSNRNNIKSTEKQAKEDREIRTSGEIQSMALPTCGCWQCMKYEAVHNWMEKKVSMQFQETFKRWNIFHLKRLKRIPKMFFECGCSGSALKGDIKTFLRGIYHSMARWASDWDPTCLIMLHSLWTPATQLTFKLALNLHKWSRQQCVC